MSAPLVTICGPTGGGKSGLAVKLALDFTGEIMNCDSVQVYRHFDIGTAKLPPQDRACVPHHLIDVTEAVESFTAGDFARSGRLILHEITKRGRLPIIAGGTGFYLRALLEGLSPGPERSELLRGRLLEKERERPGFVHRALRRFDGASAARIHPHDLSKSIRALEIRLLSSQKVSGQPPRAPLVGYRVLHLALFPPREELYRRLDERCAAMLRDGLIDEIRSLLASGVRRDAKPFQSLGYKEGLAVLENRMTLGEALAHMQRDTRRYAKRQITWFRHQIDAVHLEGFGEDPRVEAEARHHVEHLLDARAG